MLFFKPSFWSLLGLLIFTTQVTWAQNSCFDLIQDSQAAALYIAGNDLPAVQRAMGDLQSDLQKVSGQPVSLWSHKIPHAKRVILAGTLEHSPEIKQLIEEGYLSPPFTSDDWEHYSIQKLNNVWGIEELLVIVGSDRRGAIYGIYELSNQLGVSPWYFWADVPVLQKSRVSTDFSHLTIYTKCGYFDAPKVHYRGIFLNDENPALFGWVHERYGGFNHEFYSDVFELLLRLKSNYLWTAMWGKAFYDDDPLNAATADRYGVVIGTTHHEPMGRAHVEWERYGEGEWNYRSNDSVLNDFWKKGIERLEDYEASITLGMRGDGDEAMEEGTNIALLQHIVKNQRAIIDQAGKGNNKEQFQLWALYKEVQEYYEKGMRTPDDVMLLLADDNWGNLRLLPHPDSADYHPGGWGIYYHLDYVGGPRNYKWINTTQISRTWEQMNLAWEHHVDRMWLVNVGDLKPMEYPISFFLDHAWNPAEMTLEALEAYPSEWAAEQFGTQFAQEIGDMLTAYTTYNSRRKPELLDWNTYSLLHYREFETVVQDYNSLAQKAGVLYHQIPESHQEAYFQLVLFPIQASANLNELYYATALNHHYHRQGRASTNQFADRVRELYEKDSLLTLEYHQRNQGKWNHMMSQTHIGYTYWQQPEQQVIPNTFRNEPSSLGDLRVWVEGYTEPVSKEVSSTQLPLFDPLNDPSYFIELYNTGTTPLDYSLTNLEDWMEASATSGTIDKEERIYLQVDWGRVPSETESGKFQLETPDQTYTIEWGIKTPDVPASFSGFVEQDGVVSIPASQFSDQVAQEPSSYKVIPELGHQGDAVSLFPATEYERVPDLKSPHLRYDFYLENEVEEATQKEHHVTFILSPSLPFNSSKGLKMAFSIDDHSVQTLGLHEHYNWGERVANNAIHLSATTTLNASSIHQLRVWALDPSIVLQKIVIHSEALPPSYLGPPASLHLPIKPTK